MPNQLSGLGRVYRVKRGMDGRVCEEGGERGYRMVQNTVAKIGVTSE